MSRFDAWLGQQRTLVDSGAAVEKIVLEGPDGSPWGTWTLRFPNLEESIEGILGTLREQLPRGKHPARLIAYAGDGSQVSLLPLTIVGASEQATDAARHQLDMQKANAILISNVEKQCAGLTAALEAANERERNLGAQYSELLGQLTRLEDYSRDQIREDQRAAARDERMAELAKQLGPLIAVGADFLGRYAAKWFAAQQQTQQVAAQQPERQVQAGTSPPVEKLEPPKPAVVDSGHEAASRESTQPRDPLSAAPAGPVRSDGEVSGTGDGRSPSGGVRRKTQKQRTPRQ